MPNVPHFVLELDVVAVVVHGGCWTVGSVGRWLTLASWKNEQPN